MAFRRALPLSLFVLLAILLTGCASSGPSTPPHSVPAVNGQYSGSVYGGQQPVAGATIQLYTVGTTADGSAATPLLTSAVMSDSNGRFTITGLYSCTNATQVYIVATGGNPGLSTTNPNIALMAALGPCSSLTSSTFISINELTTVAAISALAPYMSSLSAIGSSPSDATYLASAFTLANQYVNTATGLSPGANVPAGYTVPTTELNTLADILAACINSAGGTSGDGSLCGQLFSLTTVSPNPSPTDTIQAMLNLAYNPTLNTSALYALAPPTPPFQPTLTSAPANFAVSLGSLSPIQASPSAINFQNVTVNSISSIQTINLSNFSGLGNIRTVGPNATEFSVGNYSSTNVGYCGSGATSPCWFQIDARPTATGVRNASIAIDYNYQTSTLYIPLTVTGIASNPNSLLSTSLVNFPPTITGTSSTPVAVTLGNTGPGTLTVSNVGISGATSNNFTQTNNCSSIAVNANCTIYITFAPTGTGNPSATLQVTSTASGSNTVALSGTGVALGTPPSLSPSSLTYTIWGANEDLVLTNSGSSSISTSNVGVATTGGLEQDHAYTATNNCPLSVVSGASCTFSITNVAVHPLSTYTAGFSNVTGEAYVNGTSLTSNILTENDAYLLQGSGGVNGNGISGTVSFPQQQVGQSETASIQLGNIGSGSPAASLAIGGDNPGDFSVSAVQPTVSSTPSSYCPSASTGTQPCTITITFTPTAAGTRTAKISLDANGSSTGQYIFVTGVAINAGPSFSVTDGVGFNLFSHLPSSIDPNSAGRDTLIVTNTGNSTISLGATFSGANAPLYTVDPSDCQSLPIQSSCFVKVTFLGTAVGTYPATLQLSDKNSSFSSNTSFNGTTSYWLPLPNLANTGFGNQPVNTTGATSSFTVADGAGYVLGDPITLTLPANSNFTLPAGASCPAGPQVCSLSIAFSPHVIGSISETLTTTDTVTGATSQTALAGTGTGTPSYTLSSTSVTFPSRPVNSTSTPTTITLTSNGTQDLTVSSVSFIGAANNNFTQTNNCSTVPTNSTCSINITFAPTASGLQFATVQINSNAANSPVTIALNGTAIPASSTVLQITPSSITFPSAVLGFASSPQSVTITNTGSSPVTINSFTTTGATGATFSASTGNCNYAPLDPGGTCTFQVGGNPSASSGTGSLVVTSSAPDSPQTIPLSITGTPKGNSTASLSPSTPTYTIWGANEDFTLANTGSAPLTIGSLSPATSQPGGTSGPLTQSAHTYNVSSNGCTSPVPAGASCTFGVQSLPTQAMSNYMGLSGAVVYGTLFASDDASPSVQVSAIVTDNNAWLSQNGNVTGTVSFAGQQIGTTQTQSIQLSNIGTLANFDSNGSPAASLALSGANPGDFSVIAFEPSVSSGPTGSCPGGTAICTITISFTPTAAGTRTAKISLDPTGSSTGQYILVTGTAVGQGAYFDINPSSGALFIASHLPANIDPNSGGTSLVTVTNRGTTTLTLAAGFTGPNPSRFTADVSQCQAVAPQATCTVNLTFNSSAIGTYEGTLVLRDTSSSVTASLELSGHTVGWQPKVFSPSAVPQTSIVVSFPTQAVNTTSAAESFTIADQNQYPIGDPITVTLQSNSNFVLSQGSTCPTGNQPCTLALEFAPHATGAITEQMTLTDPVTGATNTVSIYGVSQ